MLQIIIAVVVTLVIVAPVTYVVTTSFEKKSANSKINNAEEQARAARQAQWKQEQAEKQAKRDEQKRSLAFNEAQRRYNSALSSLKYAQTETQKKEWQERVDRAYAEMLKYK